MLLALRPLYELELVRASSRAAVAGPDTSAPTVADPRDGTPGVS